jgi:hypothetical protein
MVPEHMNEKHGSTDQPTLPEGWVLSVERVEAQRAHIGIAKDEIARRWGISSGYASRILSGVQACSEERLVALAGMLHIAPTLLVSVRHEAAA